VNPWLPVVPRSRAHGLANVSLPTCSSTVLALDRARRAGWYPSFGPSARPLSLAAPPMLFPCPDVRVCRHTCFLRRFSPGVLYLCMMSAAPEGPLKNGAERNEQPRMSENEPQKPVSAPSCAYAEATTPV